MPQLTSDRPNWASSAASAKSQAMSWVKHSRHIGYHAHHGSADIRGGYLDASILPEVVNYSAEELLDHLVAGDAETVIAKLKRIEGLGVDEFSTFMDWGEPQPMVMRSLERFKKDVMPEFKGRHESGALAGAGAAG